jgi:predicted nuclease of predicted toxin-antitoxin system
VNYLIDVNVPDGLPTFQGKQFHLVKNLNPEWSDRDIWNYALENNLVIITKDTDFFHWSMASERPPKVLHLKIGNMRLSEFSEWISKNWPQMSNLIYQYQLVIAYKDRIEVIY